jgi:hypothetical protein
MLQLERDANRLVKLGALIASGKSDLAVIVYSVDKKGIKKTRVQSIDELRRLIDKE